MTAPSRGSRGSLSKRITALFLGLLVVVQLASFTAVRASLSHHAHSSLPDQLQVGGRVLQHLLAQREQRLSEGARLLGSDSEFRVALRSDNTPDLVTALALHGARIGASEAALLDSEFKLRASTSANPRELLALLQKLAEKRADNNTSSALTLLNCLPFQAVLVPVKAPGTVAWIIMALPLDQALANELHALSALNLTLLTRGLSNEPWVAALTGLPSATTAALASERWTQAMTSSRMNSISAQGNELGVRAAWLSRSATIVDGPAVLALSVNLSTRDLLDTELPQRFETLLIKHSVPAEAFCLEITESAIMDDPQRALGTLNGLSALGFKLSIDDFGTGYSSLAYLKKLPVDELKIDQSFVRNMETDSDDAKIVKSTIDLAHNLGLCVVAEGVENAQVWDMLRELNCDQAQGFHMGKPMPVEQFVAWSSGWIKQQLPKGVNAAWTLH